MKTALMHMFVALVLVNPHVPHRMFRVPPCLPGVVWYWVFDTTHPSRGWFEMSSADMTQGQFSNYGGPLILGRPIACKN